MSTASPLPPRTYDRTTIALHWVVALGVIGQWLGAHAIDWFPPGPMRVDARSVHILIGAALTGCLGFRLWWRARRGVRLPADQRPALAALAGVTHLALYALLIAVLGLGIFNAWVRGDSIMGWFRIPHFGEFAPAARHALANRVVGLHRLAANLILGLAGAHAAAALVHHFWLKDGVLRRMAPLAPAARPASGKPRPIRREHRQA